MGIRFINQQLKPSPGPLKLWMMTFFSFFLLKLSAPFFPREWHLFTNGYLGMLNLGSFVSHQLYLWTFVQDSSVPLPSNKQFSFLWLYYGAVGGKEYNEENENP